MAVGDIREVTVMQALWITGADKSQMFFNWQAANFTSATPPQKNITMNGITGFSGVSVKQVKKKQKTTANKTVSCSVPCFGFRQPESPQCRRVHVSGLLHYPSFYLEHTLLNFLLTSPSHILWVLSVLVLSAARLLSLSVRCHNSFHDSSVLSLWRCARAHAGTGTRPSPALSSSLLLYTYCTSALRSA